MRHDEVRAHLRDRYRAAWAGLDEDWTEAAGGPGIGPVVVGALLGLGMVRRVDPDALTDDVAVATICRIVAGVNTGATT